MRQVSLCNNIYFRLGELFKEVTEKLLRGRQCSIKLVILKTASQKTLNAQR